MLQYRYRPYLRPVGFATLPGGLQWDYLEAPADQPMIAQRRGIPLSTNRYGIIITDRPFTTDELDRFGMEAI